MNASHAVLPKASISFRIGISQWIPEKRFEELLSFFERHKMVTDEIFTGETPTPLTLQQMPERTELIQDRMERAGFLCEVLHG